MEQIVLKADVNVCEISGWESNTGEVNARDLQVDLCEEMSKCGNAVVTFKLADGTVYESKVKDGKADIPVTDKPQFIEIGVYTEDTVNGECVKRYSPHPVSAYINNGSYSGAGTEQPIPTAGTYAELLEMIKKGGGAIETIESPKIWELETGVYRVTGTIKYGTAENQHFNFMGIVTLIVNTQEVFGTKTNTFYLFHDGIVWGSSYTTLTADGERQSGIIFGHIPRTTDYITTTEETGMDIPTAGAVANYIGETIVGVEEFGGEDEEIVDDKVPSMALFYGGFLSLLEQIEELNERVRALEGEYTQALELLGGAE